MVSTVPLDELEKHAGNIYEAIVVIAKRARQVNDEQKRYLEQELGFDTNIDPHASDEEEEAEETHEERQARATKAIRLPKPTTISLTQMLAGKLDFHYAELPEVES